jgi:hypothetical protein
MAQLTEEQKHEGTMAAVLVARGWKVEAPPSRQLPSFTEIDYMSAECLAVLFKGHECGTCRHFDNRGPDTDVGQCVWKGIVPFWLGDGNRSSSHHATDGAGCNAWVVREAVRTPPYPPLNFPGELKMAKAILERHGWFVVSPPQRAPAGCSANYDPRVWQLLELATELNRRLGAMVQR